MRGGALQAVTTVMRIIVAAVGRLKRGPESALFDHYCQRLDGLVRQVSLGPIELQEIPESRAGTVSERKADEAERLLTRAKDADLHLVLDEHGRKLNSENFSSYLGEQRDAGRRVLAILIGGPDGHGEPVLSAARETIALGAMTLPHGLARVVLLEQLYRTATILSGHPYHRA